MNRRKTTLATLRARLKRLQTANRKLRAGAAHQSSEAKFRRVIDASPVPLSVDDLKGHIEYLNRKFVEKFGYSPKEIPTSAEWFNRAYPNPAYRRQVARQWKAAFKRGLNSRKEIGPIEVDVTCKDGTLRHVEFVGTLLGDRLLVAATDITERERLEQQILEISEEERERIGQDLHDGLCQVLSGIKFRATLLEQKLEMRHWVEAREAGAIENLLNSAIQQARNMARGLHPVALEAQGLMSALEELTASVSDLYSLDCRCICEKTVLVHDHVVAMHLYRIAQEAINNALRHGHARSILVRLSRRAGRLCLVVRDNGSGFPARVRKGGMGLHLMRYRARAMRASLDISSDSTGTTVTCRLREKLSPPRRVRAK
jgi:PAS domain S-box-containing protein